MERIPRCMFSTGCLIDGDIKGACTLATSGVTLVDDDNPSWPTLPLRVIVRCSVDDPDISSCVSSFSDRATVMLVDGDGDLDFCDDVRDDRSIGAAPNICFQSSFCDINRQSAHGQRLATGILGDNCLRERGNFSRGNLRGNVQGVYTRGNVPGKVHRVCLEKFYRREGGQWTWLGTPWFPLFTRCLKSYSFALTTVH